MLADRLAGQFRAVPLLVCIAQFDRLAGGLQGQSGLLGDRTATAAASYRIGD